MNADERGDRDLGNANHSVGIEIHPPLKAGSH